jgi:hypothetical protein
MARGFADLHPDAPDTHSGLLVTASDRLMGFLHGGQNRHDRRWLSALALARPSDLIASVPSYRPATCSWPARLSLPVATPEHDLDALAPAA